MNTYGGKMDSISKHNLGMILLSFGLATAGTGLGLTVSGYSDSGKWADKIEEVCPKERTLSDRINNVETTKACMEAEEGLDSSVKMIFYAFIPLFMSIPMCAAGHSYVKKSREETK